MSLEVRFTLPDQDPQTVAVGERILLGTLFSNDVVLRAPGVEPIHAMVENVASGDYMLTDLGSEQGVILNGRKIEVESKVVIGDVVTIGSVKIDVLALGASAAELFQTATTTPPVLNKKHAKPTHIPGAYDPDNMQDVDDVEDRLPSFFDKVNKTNNDEEAVRLEDPEDTNPINSMYIEEKKGRQDRLSIMQLMRQIRQLCRGTLRALPQHQHPLLLCGKTKVVSMERTRPI